LGDEADETILTSTSITDEEGTKYDMLIAKRNIFKFFLPKRDLRTHKVQQEGLANG